MRSTTSSWTGTPWGDFWFVHSRSSLFIPSKVNRRGGNGGGVGNGVATRKEQRAGKGSVKLFSFADLIGGRA